MSSRSDDDLLAFHRHLQLHGQLQAQVKGAQTEIARALGSFRIPIDGGDAITAQRMDTFFTQLGGHKNAKDALMKYQSLGHQHNGTAAQAAFASKLAGRGTALTGRMIKSAYINGLLSGPATHLLNMGSNLMFAQLRIMERAIAAGIPGGGVDLGEAAAMSLGAMHAARDMMTLAQHTMGAKITDRSPEAKARFDETYKHLAEIGLDDDGNQKIHDADVQTRRVFTSQAMGLPDNTNAWVQNGINGLGMTIEWPGMALGASDGFFKTFAYRQELYALAYRRASENRRLGMPDDQVLALMEDTVRNPPDEIHMRAMDYARTTTFTQQLGPSMSRFSEFVNSTGVGWLFMPFIKTPTNVVKAAGGAHPNPWHLGHVAEPRGLAPPQDARRPCRRSCAANDRRACHGRVVPCRWR